MQFIYNSILEQEQEGGIKTTRNLIRNTAIGIRQ